MRMGKQGSKKRKNLVKGLSIFLAAAILLGGIGGYSLFHVKAQGVLTGLESKVSGKVSGNQAFVILEVIPDGSEGEIGTLVRGQEKEFVPQGDTKDQRSAYMAALETKYAAYIGNDKPFVKNENYQEAFFVSDSTNWNVLELQPNQYAMENVRGSYEPATDEHGTYKENITGFCENAAGSYDVEFDINKRTDTSESLYQQKYVSVSGTSKYRLEEPADDVSLPRYYVQSYEYKGTGNGSYESFLDTAKPYSYVAQEGQLYKFTADDKKPECAVEIGRIYYKGSIASQDWLRTKVLKSANSAGLQIEVNTVTESELQSYDTSNVDMVYLCADTTDSGKTYQNKTAVWGKIQPLVSAKVPCILDAQSGIASVCGEYAQGYAEGTDFVKESLYIMPTGNDSVRLPIYADFEKKISDTQGLSEVSAYVKKENTLRSGEDKLSKDLTRAFLLQYIIDFSGQRNLEVKDSYRVLEIQPTAAHSADTKDFTLTEDIVAEWAGYVGGKPENVTITIDSMSTAEFIGKTEDLNKKYDLIYIGACIEDLNTTGSGALKSTVYNDTRMNGLVYSHTGDYVVGKLPIIGMLDVDYAAAFEHRDKTPRPYAKLKNAYLYNNGGSMITGYYNYGEYRTDYTNNILTQRLENVSLLMYYNFNETISMGKSVVGDLMVYRYSGNDITKTKAADLMEYVQANYPIVVSDMLYQTDGSANKSVNTQAVDNTSYLYEFLDEIKANENVFSIAQVQSTDSSIGTYLNVPKLSLQYFDVDNPTDLATYQGEFAEAGSDFTDISKMKMDTKDSKQTGVIIAKAGFLVQSVVDVSESTTYTPDFYIDLNADGKFLVSGNGKSSEKMDCLIYNYETGEEAPKDAEGNYQLTSGVRYVLEKEIPSSYLGVLTWKLEVKQSSNPYVRTSDIQYTKVNGNSKTETVRVLQISSQNASSNNTTINLQNEETIQRYLQEVEGKTGLKFEITTIGGYDFQRQYATSGENFYNKYLKDYDMLIIGFADTYYDLENTYGGIDAIKIFINSGKSVMFSHDTTSYINVPENKSYTDIHLAGFSDDLDGIHEWGYDMNQTFRDVLGMDRYGIASDTNEVLSAQQNLLRQGQHLTVQKDHTDAEGSRTAKVNKCKNTKDSNKMVYFTTRGITEGSLSSNRDIAYAANTYQLSDGTAQSYGQTQGYTNGILNQQLVTDTKYLEAFGKKQQKTNLKSSLSVTGSNASGRARTQVTSVNDGLITHFPYEIGSQFTSAATHYQYYQLNLDQDDDGDNKGDMVVWYCMSGSSDSNADKVYGSLPNDVRNNYYIYNIGNVTYTGMGHTSLVHDGADLETKLFINTMVAAYKAGVEEPTLKILETPSRTAAEKQYEYITYDDAINGTVITDTVSYYFTVSDPNLTSSQKTISMEYAYYDANANRQILSGSDITVKDITTGTAVTDGLYTSGHVYQVTLNGMAGKMAGVQEATLEAKVTSSFDYYGKQETHSATKQLRILKTQLMNLR